MGQKRDGITVSRLDEICERWEKRKKCSTLSIYLIAVQKSARTCIVMLQGRSENHEIDFSAISLQR